MLQQRLTIITLGVSDLAVSRQFYTEACLPLDENGRISHGG